MLAPPGPGAPAGGLSDCRFRNSDGVRSRGLAYDVRLMAVLDILMRYLHIVAAMFPKARVIHLRRNRPDTMLSLWSQDFAHPDLGFAYDFDDMQTSMGGHDALLRCWKQKLQLPILELDYETLVTEPDDTLARLCDFIGRGTAVTASANDASPVMSASVWQARQPVYRTSVGRWRSYAPFVPELGRFAEPA